MTNRERALAILRYQNYDRLPIVHFGFWGETIDKWVKEGHISPEMGKDVYDGSPNECAIVAKLGFDFNWNNCISGNNDIYPLFEREVLEKREDGTEVVRNIYGVIELEKPGVESIPSEIGHTLVDRASWEKEFLPRLQFTQDRLDLSLFAKYTDDSNRDVPLALHAGSLFGKIRDWVGVENISYMYIDDEDLYTEIIDTVGDLAYQCAKAALESGAKFDYAHYWEDICFKNGPLVVPDVFAEKVGPHYKRINSLINSYGIDIISLDCDGMIDSLIPIWLENGVNTMFPIEVGTWNANIKPWREKYGKQIRGVGGMNKTVFARDYAAIDAEIERLKALVALGGYIPCPDHRIAPDAKWENVQYYCDKMHRVFG